MRLPEDAVELLVNRRLVALLDELAVPALGDFA
jgi:hypothetical protein